jgi:hypothetical protein
VNTGLYSTTTNVAISKPAGGAPVECRRVPGPKDPLVRRSSRASMLEPKCGEVEVSDDEKDG